MLRQNHLETIRKPKSPGCTGKDLYAHNAAFEDSAMFRLLHRSQKKGKIIVIDSRDICRRWTQKLGLFPVSLPAALENWSASWHTW